ncbi:hypothetical protein HW555_000631 [Spodoptera exigua]|uniref:Uncharacterized protein n=1 Tax=Spodoptera exigua TaxID=7107 RepID=A0A835GVR3_SPOEX|nr:hypothetical protein HW555_000631 [Spodoptera exigua]
MNCLYFTHREGCYIQEINDVIPFGHSVTVGHCTQIRCATDLMYYVTPPRPVPKLNQTVKPYSLITK